MKMHNLKRIVIDNCEYQYFYMVEKYYANGNGRYRVFIIDPDAPGIYETVIKDYITLLPYRIKTFIETAAGVTVPLKKRLDFMNFKNYNAIIINSLLKTITGAGSAAALAFIIAYFA